MGIFLPVSFNICFGCPKDHMFLKGYHVCSKSGSVGKNGPTPGVTICSNSGSVDKNGPTPGVTISSNNGSVVKNGSTPGVTISSNNGSVVKNSPTPGVTICSNNGSVAKNGPNLGVTCFTLTSYSENIKETSCLQPLQGRIQDFWKWGSYVYGFIMYKGVGACFADFISFFLNIT